MIGKRQVFLIFQAATEDLSKVEAGFELLRDTLRAVAEQEQGDVGAGE